VKTKGALLTLSPHALRAFAVNVLLPDKLSGPKSKRIATPPVTATAGVTTGAETPLIVTTNSVGGVPVAGYGSQIRKGLLNAIAGRNKSPDTSAFNGILLKFSVAIQSNLLNAVTHSSPHHPRVFVQRNTRLATPRATAQGQGQ